MIIDAIFVDAIISMIVRRMKVRLWESKYFSLNFIQMSWNISLSVIRYGLMIAMKIFLCADNLFEELIILYSMSRVSLLDDDGSKYFGAWKITKKNIFWMEKCKLLGTGSNEISLYSL